MSQVRNLSRRWTVCLIRGHRWSPRRADYRLPDDGTRPYRVCLRCRLYTYNPAEIGCANG